MDLTRALEQHFGYPQFRPLQREIVDDSLAGRDVLVLMPTGGGKSLCFQLPALLRTGLTIVVSPLISLMKDQVDALRASGIAAAFLNSALDRRAAVECYRGLSRGEYRLLYVAPERLMLGSFLERALNWNIAQFAIDEAHCISEWGHDFRPEYRELKKLRAQFPSVPVMALTATATERVRTDIVTQLQLRNPRQYVASFNRVNLTYRVLAKSSPYEQLLTLVRSRAQESGIVYCASRKAADSLAVRLSEDGVTARAYHAGMKPTDRAKYQEMFLRDDIRVITATIAFGMGINKPNVRFVVHYDLPKNLESYYQETGRAGRDGLPAECILLFSPGDVAKQLHFIDEKSEPEQRVAREQLRKMVEFAETRECRRSMLLRYFGEKLGAIGCNACDNCLAPRETFDGTVPAQKFLSCVYRIYAKHGFGFGLNHVVDVLSGAETDPIRQRGHNRLSTYGIGRELKRRDWLAIGRELLRLGLVTTVPGKFPTLQLTSAGLSALRERKAITLTKPYHLDLTKPQTGAIGGIECDEALLERLRAIRRTLANERDVPAYIIFSDSTLREMARDYPTTPVEFRGISGVGEQKVKQFAKSFLPEINNFLAGNPRPGRGGLSGNKTVATPQAGSATTHPWERKPNQSLNDSQAETLRRFRRGESVEQIARARNFAQSTIYGHLVAAIQRGTITERDRFFTATQEQEIAAAFRKTENQTLTEVTIALNRKYDIGELRVFRAFTAQRKQPWRRE